MRSVSVFASAEGPNRGGRELSVGVSDIAAPGCHKGRTVGTVDADEVGA
jgi:hypothetical protein